MNIDGNPESSRNGNSTYETEEHNNVKANAQDVPSSLDSIQELNCGDCDYENDDPVLLKTHKEARNSARNIEKIFQCGYCAFTVSEEIQLKTHKQSMHQSLKVDLVTKKKMSCPVFSEHHPKVMFSTIEISVRSYHLCNKIPLCYWL